MFIKIGDRRQAVALSLHFFRSLIAATSITINATCSSIHAVCLSFNATCLSFYAARLGLNAQHESFFINETQILGELLGVLNVLFTFHLLTLP